MNAKRIVYNYLTFKICNRVHLIHIHDVVINHQCLGCYITPTPFYIIHTNPPLRIYNISIPKIGTIMQVLSTPLLYNKCQQIMCSLFVIILFALIYCSFFITYILPFRLELATTKNNALVIQTSFKICNKKIRKVFANNIHNENKSCLLNTNFNR